MILLENRKILISGQINDETVEDVFKMIMTCNVDDDSRFKSLKEYTPNPISIYINSCGGQTVAGLACADLIENSKTPIWGYAMGTVQSAAISILLSCHKRFSYKNTRFLIHQASQSLGYDKVTEVSYRYNELINYNNMSLEYIKERSKIPATTLNRIVNNGYEYYFDVEEALKYKVIHEIIK